MQRQIFEHEHRQNRLVRRYRFDVNRVPFLCDRHVLGAIDIGREQLTRLPRQYQHIGAVALADLRRNAQHLCR